MGCNSYNVGLLLGFRVVGVLVTENIVLKRGRVAEIDGFSAKVMVHMHTGDTIELTKTDHARLLGSTCTAEEIECDRN